MIQDHKTIRIGGIDYRVEYVPGLHEDGAKLTGCISHNHTLIQIEADQAAPSMMQTLFHEILHAILEQAGQREGVSHKALAALAYGLVGVLRDSPWLGLVVEL